MNQNRDQNSDQTGQSETIFSPLDYQGTAARGFAHILDQIIIATPFFIYALLTSDIQSFEESPWYAFIYAIFFCYHIYLEFKFGQTIGKKLFKMKVVMENGQPLTLRASLIRNFARLIDILPSIYIVGIFTIALTKKRQRVGDLIAQSVVVKK